MSAAYTPEQMLIDLQTCLHLLGEEGYIGDPDFPEVDAILARYEKAVSCSDTDPIRTEFDRFLDLCENFGNRVLFCDTYGCESGPAKCLHADARRFLDEIEKTGDKLRELTSGS